MTDSLFQEEESNPAFRKVRKPKDWYEDSDTRYYGNDTDDDDVVEG